MKVLCINTNGLHNDGITNGILNYYGHMDKHNLEIDLLKTKDVESSLEKRIEALELGLKFTDYRKHVLSYIFKTAKLIRREKYDIVHTHGSSAILSIDLLAAWLGGCKVRIAHSRNTKCNHVVVDKLLRPLFYLLTTNRFACGEDAGKWLFGKRDFTVIRNGKDLEQFKFSQEKRDAIRKKYGWTNKIILGHVGNFNYQKNHEFLLNVFAKLQKQNADYYLVLMGTGQDYLQKAKEQVKELQIEDKVLFMGSINDVSDMLNAMDVMLFPSHFEGLPNVVLEWQCSGVPAVISDKITKECKVTDLVKYLPIDQGVDIWCDEVINIALKADRVDASQEACESMRQAQFDIVENAKYLRQLYFSFIDEA